MSQVKVNNTVKVHYTGKLENGQIFDSSLQREPLEFTIGQGQLIPGFEKGVIEMKVIKMKTINIPNTEAFGDIKEAFSTRLENTKPLYLMQITRLQEKI